MYIYIPGRNVIFLTGLLSSILSMSINMNIDKDSVNGTEYNGQSPAPEQVHHLMKELEILRQYMATHVESAEAAFQAMNLTGAGNPRMLHSRVTFT